MSKNITIVDVAREAQVSIGTVSRVFNGHNVNEKLKAKVHQTAERLHYTPNVFARNLQTEKTGTIGILLHHRHSMDSTWAQKIILWTARILTDYGYRSMLIFHEGDNETPPDVIDLVDGCVVWGSFTDGFYRNLEKRRRAIPLISYSRRIPYKNSSAVLLRNDEATQQALEYLLASGHRKIGMVVHYKLEDRISVYKETMKVFKIKCNPSWIDLIGTDRDPMKLAYDSTNSIMDLSDRPTGIVYGSDILAIGGLEALKYRNLDVPGDVSIVGFDDIPESRVTYPKLTTMGIDPRELAKTLIENLEHRLIGREIDDEIYVSRYLIRRESVSVRH